MPAPPPPPPPPEFLGMVAWERKHQVRKERGVPLEKKKFQYI